ncbi:hypothetical protein WOLCODRAFT_159275 [Wolfiporia cocos MD-104 SS10]|uniref:PLP-dependent transferase n=1 Tax=Wolfiporia cocos (strain MD-104) TaxID=742152 RepID=A0A2H3JU87_WOLCO|nr:hypothetical protein WOLCODRAFT_159275 [Wolfiporia cocos MD-104 SS10]
MSSKRPHTPYDDEDLDIWHHSTDSSTPPPVPQRPAKKKRTAVRKSWKGWVEGSLPPSKKLINLDVVTVLQERKTHSGKSFDDKDSAEERGHERAACKGLAAAQRRLDQPWAVQSQAKAGAFGPGRALHITRHTPSPLPLLSPLPSPLADQGGAPLWLLCPERERSCALAVGMGTSRTSLRKSTSSSPLNRVIGCKDSSTLCGPAYVHEVAWRFVQGEEDHWREEHSKHLCAHIALASVVTKGLVDAGMRAEGGGPKVPIHQHTQNSGEVGPGCHHLGDGLDKSIDELKQILKCNVANSSSPPALSLFTKFPSYPLLRSPNLSHLRALADQHNFLLMVDETIGNFANVEVLLYVDIIVSSLRKVFSGDANVVGGSLVLNLKGHHYTALKANLTQTYEDCYFDEDTIYMECNSCDFKWRIEVIDGNTLAVCSLLHSCLLADPSTLGCAMIKDMLYPRETLLHTFETTLQAAEAAAAEISS